MPGELRTGLVEAIARMLIDDPHCDDATNQKVWDELAFTVKDGTYEKAGAIVDRMLGFLTDNAEAWREAADELWTQALEDEEFESNLHWLIAALSDSRDTGEKP